MKTLRKDLAASFGKKKILFACTMLAKKMSPLMVPMDTVKFINIRNTTSSNPARAMPIVITAAIQGFEHCWQTDDPRDRLKLALQDPHSMPD